MDLAADANAAKLMITWFSTGAWQHCRPVATSFRLASLRCSRKMHPWLLLADVNEVYPEADPQNQCIPSVPSASR